MFISLAKLNIIIYLFYYTWYQEIWGASPIMLYLTSFFSIGFVLLDILSTKKIIIKETDNFIKMYIFFGLYALITGIFVCIDINVFFKSYFRYFSFVLLLYSIWYVCHKNKSIDWLISTIFITSLLCAFTSLFFGKAYQVEVLVTTMSQINNPNTLGLSMIMGIFATILNLKKMSKYFLLSYSSIMIFLLVIIRCGSRKSLFAGITLVVLWLIEFLSNKSYNKLNKKKLISYLIIGMSIIFAYNYVVNHYLNSTSFERLLKLFGENGTTGRIQLYKWAIEYWKTSPLFGIGLDQYKILCPYGYFSHSAYAELLSCTGIFGIIIFFFPIISLIFKLLKTYFIKKQISYTAKISLLMILIELFLGIGQVYTFSFQHLLIFFCISFLVESELRKI